MKNIHYQYIYLGGAILYFADISCFNWKFYAIVVPFLILDVVKKYEK